MRTAALLMMLATVACQTSMPPDDTMSNPPATATPTATVANESKLAVAPDTAARLAQLPRTVIDYDRALLNENERQVVARLIEASKIIDEIFWRQVSEQNPAVRARLARQADSSALDRAGYEYFLANKGRWDRLKQDDPFIEPFGAVGAKPRGAAFYPPDITREEFERYVAAHPEQKAALEGLFTVVRRDGAALVAIPYSRYYGPELTEAAQHVREAADLTTNASLKNYLTRLATALLSDNYRQSDMAWMDLTGPIEVVIGPYEVYEDDLFNFKASFESFVTVVDRPESEKLAIYAQHLPAMERNLPEPDEYRNGFFRSPSPEPCLSIPSSRLLPRSDATSA